MSNTLPSQLSNSSIIIDSITQDYVQLNGQIANGNSLECRIYQLLRTPVTQWLYAPTATYGSQFNSLKNSRQRLNKTQVAQFIINALEPLTASGDLIITSILIPVLTIGTVTVEILGIDNQGNSIKYVVNPLI